LSFFNEREITMKTHPPTLRRSRRWFTAAAIAGPASAMFNIPAANAQSTPESDIQFLGSPYTIVYRNQVHLFGRGTDELLYHSWRDGESWSTWSLVNRAHIPIDTDVEPFVVQVEDSLVAIWCAGHGGMQFRFFDNEAGWEIDAAHLSIESYDEYRSSARAAFWNSNLYVFGTAEGGVCTWSTFDLRERRGVWNHIDAEWTAVGPPAVVATDETLSVFWTSDTGIIYQTQFNGDTWHRWLPVGR
jgi:hypothetical protein